jgi:hypothetical protein
VLGGKIIALSCCVTVAVARLAAFCPMLAADDWPGAVPLPSGDFASAHASALAREPAGHDLFLSNAQARCSDSRQDQHPGAVGKYFGEGLTGLETASLIDCDQARRAETMLRA